MKKFVINLQRRVDRRERFIEENNQIQDYVFFDAIDGYTINHKNFYNKGFKINRKWWCPLEGRPLTKGEIGCFLSHWNLWLKCIEIDQPIMILEDDVVFQQSYNEEKIEQLITEYDLLYLSRFEYRKNDVVSINDELEIPAHPYWGSGYVITPDTAKKLISTDINQNIIPVDEYLPIMIKQMNVAAFKQNVIEQHNKTFPFSEDMSADVDRNHQSDYFIDFETHVLTVGTDVKKCDKLYYSAEQQNIKITNLGEGVQWNGGTMETAGGGQKINLIRDHLNNLPDKDVVLFVDGYDVFFNSNLEEIVGRYVGFNTKILFSSEKTCWPDESIANMFPICDTEYRYLNSGTFIGEVEELKRLLADSIEDNQDDQLFIQKRFLTGDYDIKLDYEQYIFATHDTDVAYDLKNELLYNPNTKSFSCIYHGNGPDEAKQHLELCFNSSYPQKFFIGNNLKYDVIGNEIIMVDYMTKDQCEDMIDKSERVGGFEPGIDDPVPGQELTIDLINLYEAAYIHWLKEIRPVIADFWNPQNTMGLRYAFLIKYDMEGQRSLPFHTDHSLVTGSVKLNDNYTGGELVFPRQNVSNKEVPVGKCILFPGQVTHGHQSLELQSGTKYSLTLWSKRQETDVLMPPHLFL